MNNKLIYEPQGKSRSCFVVREYRRQRDTLEESKLVFFYCEGEEDDTTTTRKEQCCFV